MKILKEISEKSLGKSDTEILGEVFALRKSARAVLFNEKDEVSLQFVGKWNYYKLPGGGVEIDETIEEALRREIIEEVGCDISIEEEIGVVIEYRNTHKILHISYGYFCRVQGDIRGPRYEQGEIDDGFQPLWKPLDEAIQLLKIHRPDEPYQAQFITEREITFLEVAKGCIL